MASGAVSDARIPLEPFQGACGFEADVASGTRAPVRSVASHSISELRIGSVSRHARLAASSSTDERPQHRILNRVCLGAETLFPSGAEFTPAGVPWMSHERAKSVTVCSVESAEPNPKP